MTTTVLCCLIGIYQFFGLACCWHFHIVCSEEAAFLSSAQVNSYETRVLFHNVISHSHKKWDLGCCERGAAEGFGSKGKEVRGRWRKFVILRLINFVPHPLLLRQINKDGISWTCSTHQRGKYLGISWWISWRKWLFIYLFVWRVFRQRLSLIRHLVSITFDFQMLKMKQYMSTISVCRSLLVGHRVCSKNGDIFLCLWGKGLGLDINSKSDIENGLGEKYFRKVLRGFFWLKTDRVLVKTTVNTWAT